MTRTSKVAARIGLIALVVGVLAGCDPITLPGGGGTPGSCPVGTWTVDTMTIPSPIVTPFGTLTIQETGPGVSLNITDTDWTLHAEQTIKGTLTSPLGSASGQVDILADAHGTYTSTASTLTFTLGNVTGSVDYNVTIFGHTFTGSVPLATSGLQKFYGLSATAKYGCDSNGLTLQFTGEHMHAHD